MPNGGGPGQRTRAARAARPGRRGPVTGSGDRRDRLARYRIRCLPVAAAATVIGVEIPLECYRNPHLQHFRCTFGGFG
ncbi:hypothetical protein UK82_16190 [Frankia sp. ACN1ag]|nr:hypothetical protein UK82_16190 [Frankia sp. ACN1ag]